jgi:hypothetical protein
VGPEKNFHETEEHNNWDFTAFSGKRESVAKGESLRTET